MTDNQDRTWYEEGLRFECTRCGNCCRTHGEYAYVFLEEEDVIRIAAELGITPWEFREESTTRVNGWLTLRFENEACEFLGSSGCRIYSVRPKQCRTWPFWPKNLERKIWDEEIRPVCPGIGQGRLYSKREVDEIADSM